MDLIKGFLDKYKNLAPPDASTKKLLSEIIHKECGITISSKSIHVKYGGVNLRCHPAERSEIVRCAPQILSVLQYEYNIRLSYIR